MDLPAMPRDQRRPVRAVPQLREGAMSQDARDATQTVTVMQFRKSPGYYFFRVLHDGAQFLFTHKGKPCAKLVPCDVPNRTIVFSDGTIKGEIPLTYRRSL